MARAMTAWSSNLMLCSNGRARLGAAQRKQLSANAAVLVTAKIERLVGPGAQLQASRFKDGHHVRCEALFFDTPCYPTIAPCKAAGLPPDGVRGNPLWTILGKQRARCVRGWQYSERYSTFRRRRGRRCARCFWNQSCTDPGGFCEALSAACGRLVLQKRERTPCDYSLRGHLKAGFIMAIFATNRAM